MACGSPLLPSRLWLPPLLPLLLPLLLLLLLESGLSSGQQEDPCLQTRLAGRFYPEFVFLARRVTSEAQCRRLCLRAKLCKAFNFRSSSRMCELTADLPGSPLDLAKDDESVFGVLDESGQCPEFTSDPCRTRPCSVNHLCVRVHHQEFRCLLIGSPCGQAPAQQDGAQLVTSGGLEAHYACPESDVATQGSKRSVCLATGSWSAPALSCQVDCGAPPATMTRAQLVSSNGTNLGAQALYQCQAGTSHGGQAQVSSQCRADHSWMPVECQVDCGLPIDVQSGSLVAAVSSTQVGSVAEYVCDENFLPVPSNVSVCQDTGNWTAVACVVDCSDPPDAMGHATRSTTPSSTLQGATVRYQCDQDYVNRDSLANEVDSSCLANGSWSLVSCTYRCQPPLPPAHTLEPPTNVQQWAGSSVTYHCKTGYHITPGSRFADIICVEGSGWTTFTCIIVDCGEPPSLLSLGQLMSYTGTTYLSQANYPCGLTTVNSFCQESGQWSTPSCLLNFGDD